MFESGAGDCGVVGFEGVAGGGGVVCAGEQVGVDLECDAGVGVAELARDEHDVEAVGDQQRGEAVAERVQRQPAGSCDAGAADGGAEVLADLAVVAASPGVVGKYEVRGTLSRPTGLDCRRGRPIRSADANRLPAKHAERVAIRVTSRLLESQFVRFCALGASGYAARRRR